MAKNCPDIFKVLNHQHQEQVSKMLNENNSTIRHSTMKLQKTKSKEKMFK